MATRSFLLESDIDKAWLILMGGAEGAVFPAQAGKRREALSLWLEGLLLERLQSCGDFLQLEPVVLGSWARHELCPKSDIDLLFAGPEPEVQEFVTKAFAQGLKLRSRTPEDAEDWSVGVQPFDVLAMRQAVALNPRTEKRLEPQRRWAIRDRRRILAAIRREREDRRKRQDSVGSFLEPNLKYGAGAIRDIEQALRTREIFPERFADVSPYPFTVLNKIKDELLFLRCALHLLGSNDILSATDQLELSRRLHMDSAAGLMKFVQSELERASFYADWVVAQAGATPAQRAMAQRQPTTLDAAVQALREHPHVLAQFPVRLAADELVKPLSAFERGRVLSRALNSDCSDQFLLALYRTRTLEVLIPDIKRLKGLVQHDHYHRFTADAHLFQALREVHRAKVSQRSLGAMSKLTRDLTTNEWWTLKLTALFHDLAKGRKGDHSREGAKLVDRYFTEWDFPESIRSEVSWLVENHLLLSTAAFRQNPQAQSTWKRLFERGVHGRRLVLLALFTAIDIRATNPDAWTEWKSRLLFNLVNQMRSPQALTLQTHLKHASKEKMSEVEETLLALDPVLLEALPPRILVQDLREVAVAQTDLIPKVIVWRKRVWVRFHRRSDESGLFLSFVRQLYGFGLNVQLASVNTLEGIGVYDWFCLRTEKSPRQIGKWLELPVPPTEVPVPKVEFQSIELMAQEPTEWIFSFRGRDQRGLLLAAAQALHAQQLSLRWARVHTWGQQIEDVFSVQPLGEVDANLQSLRQQFVT